ncbi:9227_t:CDS:2 [Paraglomus occultum]|uniref:9227_t:CDS:1 n=1 Tax=Paraglomus occultum TaxID=144539 RepID=A0A9N9AS95_9GLOM|nr:9227_t:CDS:2 [Paraglomus occultum]
MDRLPESVTDWDVNQVITWLTSMGYSAYESQIKREGINGEILAHLDHTALKELGIHSVGHRVSLLKAIYNLKIEHNIPLDSWDYVPPSAEFENELSIPNGTGKIELQDKVIQLSKEVMRLSHELSKLREELVPVWKIVKENKPLPEPELIKQNYKSSSSANKGLQVQLPSVNVTHHGSRSPTHTSDTPRSPRKSNYLSPQKIQKDGSIRLNVHNNRTGELLEAFRVSHDDPCHKVLPDVLKRYKINGDWHDYALFICYDRQERCLSYDEKPLVLFQKLKEAGRNPCFALKNINELQCPVATVEQTFNSVKANKSKRRTTLLNKELPPAPHELEQQNSTAQTYDNNEQDDIERVEGNGAAMVVFPYVPENADEVNVIVGDVVTIRAKSEGWCYVEKGGQAGWVPASCVFETSINGGDMMDRDSPYVGRGVAVVDYVGHGENELSMKAGDKLRIYKKSNHWLYCEINDERGWVPSWYVRIDREVIDERNTQPSDTHGNFI